MKAVLIPGDGIGREIAESVREVSAALNTGIEWQEFACLLYTSHTPALVGLGVSLVCLLIFGSSDFLIPSMVGITAALRRTVSFLRWAAPMN